MGSLVAKLSCFWFQSFWLPAPALTEKNLPDQDGKVFLITGANTGIGFELADILYGRHGTVYLACRSQEKAEAAIANIKDNHRTSRGKLNFLQIDLSDLSTIGPAAREFLAKETRLDWLDHNAGISLPPTGMKGAQGHDIIWCTNVLSPFLLTNHLAHVLQDTARESERGTVRVSWAGSIVVELAAPKNGVPFNDKGEPPDLNESDLYAASKAANVLLAQEFGRRTDVVMHNSYNPGNLKSDLLRHLRQRAGKVAGKMLDLLLWPPRLGAYTELYAGLSPDLTLPAHQGGYVAPWGRDWSEHFIRTDLKIASKENEPSDVLWAWCERETRAYAP